MAVVQRNCLILSLGWPKIYEFSLVKCKKFKTNPNGYHGRNQTGHKGTMSTIPFFLILDYTLQPKKVYFPLNFHFC